MLSIGGQEGDPKGTTEIKFTTIDLCGTARQRKRTVKAPTEVIFKIDEDETVTLMEVKTSDGLTHQLNYPKLGVKNVLHSYYSDWWGDEDSLWTRQWISGCGAASNGCTVIPLNMGKVDTAAYYAPYPTYKHTAYSYKAKN